MFKALKTEIKDLLSTKWKIISYILLLFVPLVYGGMFLAGFWAPMQNLDKLNMKIVNLDNDPNGISKTMADQIAKSNIEIRAGSRTYNMHLSVSNIYSSEDDVQNAVNAGKIDAAFTIPKNFEKNIVNSLSNNLPTWIANTINDPTFRDAFNKYIQNPTTVPLPIVLSFITNMPNLDLPKLNFYNSYKNNFLTGELTNLVANTDSMKIALIDGMFYDISQPGSKILEAIEKAIDNAVKNNLPSWAQPQEKQIEALINNVLKYLGTKAADDQKQIQKAISSLVIHKSVGENITSYGRGESPYFFSIAIWAGMLVAGFVLKNQRTKEQRKQNTFLNYFAKTLTWVGTSWIQVTLLWLFVVLFWGIHSGFDAPLFFSMYVYMLFIGMLFALIVQAILFMFFMPSK